MISILYEIYVIEQFHIAIDMWALHNKIFGKYTEAIGSIGLCLISET